MVSHEHSVTLNESIHSRFQALQGMARRIVHDANNYYGIIQGYVSLIEANLAGHDMLDKYLPPMKEALQSGIDFNKRLADFYRESQPMVAEIDLPLVVQEVCEAFAVEHDFAVAVRTVKAPGRVALDEPVLRILIEGLCKLTQYAKTDPALITIDQVELPEKDIRAMVFESHPGRYAAVTMELSLEQNTPETVIACLDPFALNSESSKNLGLALLYNHLRNHHGNLNVIHRGDTITLILFYPEREA
ncbi:hypothetical protein ACFL5M_03060 [Candidatus Neomarinimicrobiota bacterium]